MGKPEPVKKQRRSKTARERYTLKPHERRELIAMAQRAPTIDARTIRTLAFHFDVSQGRVLDTLNMAGVPVAYTGAEAKPEAKAHGFAAASEAKQRPRLKLSVGSAPEPKAKPKPKAEPKPEPINLDLEKSRLSVRENQIASRERELTDREARVAQLELELEEALRHIDGEGTAPPSWATEREDEPLPERDPEAKPVRLVSMGFVQQVMQGLVVERDSTRRDFEAAIEANAKIVRKNEALQGEIRRLREKAALAEQEHDETRKRIAFHAARVNERTSEVARLNRECAAYAKRVEELEAEAEKVPASPFPFSPARPPAKRPTKARRSGAHYQPQPTPTWGKEIVR